MTKQCKNFIEFIEAKTGKSRQPLFDGTDPDRLYYSDFYTPVMLTTMCYLIGKRSNIRNKLK